MDGNPSLIKNYIAEGDIAAHSICKPGTVEGKAAINAGQDFNYLGVVDKLGGADGYRCDLTHGGISLVKLGGTVAFGDELVSDTSGTAIAKANGNAHENATVIGIALEAGTVGAIIRFLEMPYKTSVLAESKILVKEVALTSAQILALYTTPIEVLAAPGAGIAIVPVGCTAFLDYNSAAYADVAAGEDLVISYTDASGTGLFKFETTGFLDQTADQVRYATPSVYGDTNLTPVANAKLVAHLLVGNITTGDSPLKLRIQYRLISTAW